jgi:hypothetical protein
MLIMSVLSACKKDAYKIGLDLLPPSDTLNVLKTDTCSVVAYSVFQDSCRTDKSGTLLLGSLMDPVFGNTTASMYTQFRLTGDLVDFGLNPVLDSLVLMMRYSGSYGDTNTLQNVKVYELNEDLTYDSTYYSDRHPSTYGTLLANKTFAPKPTDSVIVYGVKWMPHLRINLNQFSNYLGNKLISAPSSALTTNQAFLTFFKGLAVETTPVYDKGALLSFNTAGTDSKLVLYYHNSTEDSLSLDMQINSQCAYFNRIGHRNYIDADPEFKQQVMNHDTSLGRNKIYVQGLAGVWTKIKLPYIKDFEKGQHIAINDALLIMKNYETDTTLSPPVQLILMKRDTAGTFTNIIDVNEGTSYFGGLYYEKERIYKFRITRHIQQILMGTTENLDLYLMVANPSTSSLNTRRVILNGTGLPSSPLYPDRLQLQIIYTKLD